MDHVFISYSHTDRDFVELLRLRLEQAGFVVWLDSDIPPGADWRTAIDAAIRESFVLIVILSPAASASPPVTYEWSFAWGIGVHVIPIMYRSTPLHPRLESLRCLDFTHPTNLPWGALFQRLRDLKRQERWTPEAAIPRQVEVPPEPIDALEVLEALRGNNVIRRNRAVARLQKVRETQDPMFINDLVLILEDKNADPTLRQRAAFALGQIRAVTVVSGLVSVLVQDAPEDVIEAVARALQDIGSPAVEALLTLLEKGTYALQRRLAAEILGRIGDPAAIEGLAAALHHDQDEVRKTAADALERIGTPEALAAVARWRYF